LTCDEIHRVRSVVVLAGTNHTFEVSAMRFSTLILGTGLFFLFAGVTFASVHRYGTKPVHSPHWEGPLDELVNSPLRASGEGSLSKSEFHFEGDAKEINELIDAYGKLDKAHLTITVGDGVTLQIQHHGDQDHYLTIGVQDQEQLDGLEVPPALAIEFMPSVMEKLDPEWKAADDRLADELKAFVEKHNAAREEASNPPVSE
jgi:hypothetical protein